MKIKSSKKIIATVFGTRPEAIKLAPVIRALKEQRHFRCRVYVTAQHRDLLNQVLRLFSIAPDVDLNLMEPNQTLGSFAARAICALDSLFATDRPDLVMVQGDTSTAFCAALAAFYHQIPIAHVEAGLRTGNLNAPWPEEANRVMVSRLANLHFAPTQTARQNLVREGVCRKRVLVTGNTVIDALLYVRSRLAKNGTDNAGLFSKSGIDPEFVRQFLNPRSSNRNKLLLITAHRRESFGEGLVNICWALRTLVERFPDVGLIFPVHPNPNVLGPVRKLLGGHENIQLIAPLEYEPFVWLMNQAHFVLTDSGGVQEEAPSLGKPVLVMRDTTERPEGIAAGTCKLVGAKVESIVAESALLLTDEREYSKRSQRKNPFGDGKASDRILKACASYFSSPRLKIN